MLINTTLIFYVESVNTDFDSIKCAIILKSYCDYIIIYYILKFNLQDVFFFTEKRYIAELELLMLCTLKFHVVKYD